MHLSAKRDIGWGLNHYVQHQDGALFAYYRTPGVGHPFLATWFANAKLVPTSVTSR